ncbi:NAD(P)-binding protein [Mollisia scopiformis]|uniref:NAD(P)-binding protein n=1 Tax=Mollisia scopiformis TaxID=149040 RepID=A0A194XKC4_MOLSC|nr:NAD(P)-binding protein [Mollisia scopiformis]KUJ20591.1 NAD(P)-binding protein [Mollisia scopiformis]
MVNVLIIGATGYIGTAVCQSLIRSGDHRVFGLARSPEKARLLEKDEIIPILGSLTDTKSLIQSLATKYIDVVVDLSGDPKESESFLHVLKYIGAEKFKQAATAGVRVPKLGYIYCSGTWVHGSSQTAVNDLYPVGALNAPTPPVELTAWRAKLEQVVLASSDVLDVMVVRPALVYGRSSAIWSSLFEPLHISAQNGEKSVDVRVEADSRPALIHVDDVATGFHAAIDKLPLIAGTGVYPVFDLVTSQESMREILDAAARELGFNGKVNLVGAGEHLFAKAISASASLNAGRARTILGWLPKRSEYVVSMDIFAKAWLTAKL